MSPACECKKERKCIVVLYKYIKLLGFEFYTRLQDHIPTFPFVAVRVNSYEMVYTLIMGGAFVRQLCLKKWTVTHEAAKVGCVDILMLLLRQGGKVMGRDGHGVTPLGIAAEYGHPEILSILIQNGKSGDLSL